MMRKKITQGGLAVLCLLFSMCCLLFAISSCENIFIIKIIDPRTVTFESNGGSRVESQTVFKNQPAKQPSTPSRSGFIFDAWYSDNDTFLRKWNFDAIPTGDITLYAKWEAKELIPVTDIAITVTGPVTGAVPAAAASGSRNFNIGEVSWSPDDNPFRGGVEYTASLTLFAHEGYVFTPALNIATINENDAAVISNTGDELTLSYTFPPTRTITGISITAQPDKLIYAHNDTLDLTGLVVTFTYNDGTTEDYAFSDFASRGITASPDQGTALSRSTHNGLPVTITYGGFTLTTDNLTVDIKVTTFVVDPIPAQTYNGSALEPAVTVRDETTVLTLTADYTVIYTDNINAGTAAVTISGAGHYEGSTGSATFIINKASIAAVALTVTGPAKSETPNVTATVSGTVHFTIEAVSWSPDDNTFLGGTVYTVSVILTAQPNYAFAPELSAATVNGYNATVTANNEDALTLSHTFAATDTKIVTSMVIKTPQTRLNYTHGDKLDLSGLVVTLDHDDGTTEDVAPGSFESKNISTYPVNGEALSHSEHDGLPVTISYGSLTQTTDDLTVDIKVTTFVVDSIPAQTYNGSPLEPQIKVRDGATELTLNTDYDVTYTNNTNAGTASVTLVGIGNYAGSTGSATFTINKANPTVTWPTGLTATYSSGQALSAITLPGNGTSSPAGTFTWTTPSDLVGNAGTRAHNMTLTPADTTNYNTMKQDVNIAVAKAAGAAVSAPTAATIGVTSVTLNAITAPANGQTVEYSRNTANTAPTSGWQTGVTFSGLTAGTAYYFFARSASNDNYNSGAASGATITTMQNIGINNVTIDDSELTDPSIGGIIDKDITLSRSGAGGRPITTIVTITGIESISWKIPGVGASADETGTSSVITLSAANTKYNSLGYHTLEITATINGMQYQKNFRFSIVE